MFLPPHFSVSAQISHHRGPLPDPCKGDPPPPLLPVSLVGFLHRTQQACEYYLFLILHVPLENTGPRPCLSGLGTITPQPWHGMEEALKYWLDTRAQKKENLGEVEEHSLERCKSMRVYDPHNPPVFLVNLSNPHLLPCLSITLCDKSYGHSQWEMRKKVPSPRSLNEKSVTGEGSFRFQHKIPTRLPLSWTPALISEQLK